MLFVVHLAVVVVIACIRIARLAISGSITLVSESLRYHCLGCPALQPEPHGLQVVCEEARGRAVRPSRHRGSLGGVTTLPWERGRWIGVRGSGILP